MRSRIDLGAEGDVGDEEDLTEPFLANFKFKNLVMLVAGIVVFTTLLIVGTTKLVLSLAPWELQSKAESESAKLEARLQMDEVTEVNNEKQLADQLKAQQQAAKEETQAVQSLTNSVAVLQQKVADMPVPRR